MAIAIERDGKQRLVSPANGVQFTEDEIVLYGELGWALMGSTEEMGTHETREKSLPGPAH